MASSKARSRKTSARQGRAAGSRPAARTSAQKSAQQSAQKSQGAAGTREPQAAQEAQARGGQARGAKPPAASPRGTGLATQAPQAPRASRGKRQTPNAAVVPEPSAPSGPPLWFQIVTLVLAVLGFAVSGYETWAHFTGSQLAGCPVGGHGTFNCASVITSPQSMVFGVFPVAVLGLVFYAVVTALMTPWAWRTRRREIGLLRLAAVVVGMGFAMYLIYAEVVQIQAICEYCTGVHVITFLLFCLTVIGAALWGVGGSQPKAPGRG